MELRRPNRSSITQLLGSLKEMVASEWRRSIRLALLSSVLSTSEYVNANFDVIVVCPSLYEVLAPREYQYFQQSYSALEVMVTLAAGSLPVDYFLEQNFGEEDVQSLRGLVDWKTRQIRSELETGAVTKKELEQIMSMCPLYWF